MCVNVCLCVSVINITDRFDNVQVHMGTHMWTNGTSRRGRRMSLELPPLQIANNVKETDFLQRRPEIYYHPFLPSPFLNGIHQQKVITNSVYDVFFFYLSVFL